MKTQTIIVPTKKELIADIIEAGSTASKNQLNKMTKAALGEILKDMLNTAAPTETKPTETKPQPAPAPEKKDEAPNEPENNTDEEIEVIHISMCGMEFDHKTKSECNTLCKNDSPDEYNKCLKHFEKSTVTPVKSTRKKSTGEGTNKWGRRIGTQAALIEDCLDNFDPMTVKEMANHAGCSVSRVRRHFLRLIHKEKKTQILIGIDGKVFLPQRFEKLEGVTAYAKK